MEAALHPPSMIEFTEILIAAALPLHPSLASNPCLSVALIEDEEVCAETPAVNGDLAAGTWHINSSLSVKSVKQSVSLVVVASENGARTRVASVTLGVAELLTRIKAQPDGYHEFMIGDSGSSIQFVMTCSVNALPSLIVNNPPSRVVTHDTNHTINSRTNNTRSVHEPDSSEPPSRGDLESEYAKVIRMADRDERKPSELSMLGCAYLALYQGEGDRAALDTAISLHEEALQCTGPFHPQLAQHAHHFFLALICRFQQSGDMVDIERAISHLQASLNCTEDLDGDKPTRLSHLGSAFLLRFECLGNLADLEDGLSSLRQAVQLTPDGHPARPASLNNLGNALQTRFGRLGGLADLEDAISSLRQAVQLTPDGHPGKSSRLSNLGVVLKLRFGRIGGLADLEDAISSLRKAVQLTSDGHPAKPTSLNSLGGALELRFDRLGGLADLEDAILNKQKAVQLTPDGHPNKPLWLSNLGDALESRFARLGGLADLEGAILNTQKAVELTPDDHPNKPGRLNSLGIALKSRFDRLGDLTDLEDAISSLRQAVQLTPDGHPYKPGRLTNLGSVFVKRFRCLGILSNLESALSAFSSAATSKSGPAMVRFKAARAWANVAEEYSRSPLYAFSCATDLLPQIAWLGLAITDQHALLADVGGIVRDAVAAAIRYEEYETAVVWAEQGRSIVWQNLLGLRNPLDDLREAYPELANRLRRIAAQLEGSVPHEPLGDNKQRAPLEDVSHKYSKLALEWDSLVEEIRTLPTFEGFLKAKTFRQLAPAAYEDDSVERHVSAINIPLERFSHEKSENLFHSLTSLLAASGIRVRDARMIKARSQEDGEAKFKMILRMLWQDVVKPTESKRPPRIWWCATDLLTFLPIHAAGEYDTQEVGEKVSDYVVSSYTPTLNAILELSDPVVREDFQVLTVAQASAPGAQPIPKTEDEVKIVQSLASSARVLNLTGKNATVEKVREGMLQSDWIHLACHGQQNPDAPMESGFLLHDRILELSEIIKMSLPQADFAFLSACQTAMGDENIAEESVHLAAGMFLSGCRGVIATTWSIRDDDAPKIAHEVYSRMFKGDKPNRKEAAHGLHEAVKSLRESGVACTSWVPFIHIGR